MNKKQVLQETFLGEAASANQEFVEAGHTFLRS